MRDYGKAKQGQKPGYGKGTKEGPTKAHSKDTQAFAGGGRSASKSGRETISGGEADYGMQGGGQYGLPAPAPKDPPRLVGRNPDGSYYYDNMGPPMPTYANVPVPQPNPKRYAGVGGPLGPPVRGPQVAHARVTAPGAAVAGAQMGSGQPAYKTTDASGMGNVRDDYGYGANAGHGYGTHDYGVGAQHAGRTFDDNYGFTDFSPNMTSAPENNSGGNSSGGGSSGGGMGGGSGGFGGADQESKG